MPTPQRRNPFQDAYDLCNRQDARAKRRDLPPVPRYMDVELTNCCNFSCFFCPTGTGQQRRKTGAMPEEVFVRLLEQAGRHAMPLRFIRWGEPTLHPRWVEYLRRAKQAGLLVHLTTNGSRLDEAAMQALVDMGLDSIKFSFQGVDEAGYREMRGRNFFEDLLARVARLHALRGDAPGPYIHVSTTVTAEGAPAIAAFRERVRPVSDSHQVGRTVLEHIDPDKVALDEQGRETLRRLKAAESVVKVHPVCFQVFDVLSVNWDGKVSACCRDYDEFMIVGDLLREDLAAIWTGRRMEAYRDILADMGHDRLPLCRTCYDMNQLRLPGVQGL
ncbi:radical SAM/SPASM domain-containing protein [Desulfocurvus vexinensis]|uniref:radical SAM/SPASM domain-containing protein n=1 Tax=Desulfocurvus vexinensis TaxID=399548 RepID=UPI00049168D5|nr:radical SAM protein [Desulfocurvus vexinensis]